MAGAKMNEVAKVVSKTGHQMMFTSWVTSTAFFNSLDPETQAILLEEGKKVTAELTAMTLETDEKYAEELQKLGVQIIDDVDVAAFQAAAINAFDAVPGLTPGVVEKVRAVIAE